MNREAFSSSCTPSLIGPNLDAIFVLHTRPSLSLRDVAEHVHLSESYSCGLLRTSSGKGFLSHLHAVRVLHAIVLLADTRELVGAIAHHCGVSADLSIRPTVSTALSRYS
jgi:AraC-like DNA-binding protein